MQSDQAQDTKYVRPKGPSWGFYALWVVANAVGTLLGLVIFFMLAFSFGGFGSPGPEAEARSGFAAAMVLYFILLMPFGAIIGTMQWLVLRRHLPLSRYWILANAFAMSIGATAGTFLPLNFASAQIPLLFWDWFVFGTVSGLVQWIILRRQQQVTHAGLWMLANILAGSFAALFAPDLGMLGGCVGWSLAGLLTGGTLLLMLPRKDIRLMPQGIA